MCILKALSDALFKTELASRLEINTELLVFALILSLRADVWKILLQVRTRPVVTQVY